MTRVEELKEIFKQKGWSGLLEYSKQIQAEHLAERSDELCSHREHIRKIPTITRWNKHKE